MNATIFGATGMVDIEVLRQCLNQSQFQQVITIGRHTTGANHPKLCEIEYLNFVDNSALEDQLAETDICFYCLGVYQGKVSMETFWEITFDYVEVLIETFEGTRPNITFCLFSARGMLAYGPCG